MRILAVKESTSVASKQDMIKAVRLYGLDKERIEKVIRDYEPGQYFVIQTDLGDIIVHAEFEVRKVTIEAPPAVKEQLAK